MGVCRRTARVVLVATALCAGARARGSVQVEPIARLSLEGGYDSNVLYDGRGGNDMGRVSPDLGVHVRDHTYSLLLTAGGDLLMYPQRSTNGTVWNQRGRAIAAARLTPRLSLDADVKGTYAFDPIGLAREGIFAPLAGSALLLGGKGRLAWRWDHEWTVAATAEEHVVRFGDGSGAASHSPGLEATKRLDPRLEIGGTYRFDWFQAFRLTPSAYAHEALGIVRWRWTRRLTLEATGGGAVWQGAAATWVIPQAGASLYGRWRTTELRLSVRHGVGLGLNATPGLFDAAEGAVTMKLRGAWELHLDGGLWRSGAPPWGSDAVLGYGVEGEIGYRIGREVLIGLAGSRFARVDLASTQFNRNVVGLRVTWERRHR